MKAKKIKTTPNGYIYRSFKIPRRVEKLTVYELGQLVKDIDLMRVAFTCELAHRDMDRVCK